MSHGGFNIGRYFSTHTARGELERAGAVVVDRPHVLCIGERSGRGSQAAAADKGNRTVAIVQGLVRRCRAADPFIASPFAAAIPVGDYSVVAW